MEDDKTLNEEQIPGSHKKPAGYSDGGNEAISSSDNSLMDKLRAKQNLFRVLRSIFILLVSVLAFVLIIVFVLYVVPLLQEMAPADTTAVINSGDIKKDAAYKKQLTLMSKDVQQLSRKFNSNTSGQSYIVINTTDNKFFLYKNKILVREGLCSSGANKILRTKKKTYIFKTPKGKFSITGKRKHPYWHRSDWDFIEQGLPVPPKDDPSRWEEGVLGDYALDLFDGYMIHGTIYKRLMGMPVTHGCIRLGDEDIEMVFNTLNIGSKVYIF